MITRSTISMFGNLIRFSSYAGGFPYTWNRKKRQLEVANNRWTLHMWRLKGLLPLYNVLYLAFRIYQNLHDQEKRSKRLKYMTMYVTLLVVFSMVTLQYLSTAFERKRTAMFINQFFRFCSTYKEHHVHRERFPIQKLFASFCVFAVLNSVMYAMMFMVFHKKRFFMACLLFDNIGYHWTLFWIFAVLELWYALTNWALILLHIFLLLSYFTSIRVWLLDLKSATMKLKKKRAIMGAGAAAGGQNTWMEWLRLDLQCLLVLNNRFKACTCPILVTGHQLIMVPMVVITSYNVVQLRHSQPVEMQLLSGTVLIACLVFQYTFYAFSADVYDVSQFLLSNLAQRRCQPSNLQIYHPLFLRNFRKPTRYSSSFAMFRQWRPQAYLRRLVFSNFKIHTFLQKNISEFNH